MRRDVRGHFHLNEGWVRQLAPKMALQTDGGREEGPSRVYSPSCRGDEVERNTPWEAESTWTLTTDVGRR